MFYEYKYTQCGKKDNLDGSTWWICMARSRKCFSSITTLNGKVVKMSKTKNDLSIEGERFIHCLAKK